MAEQANSPTGPGSPGLRDEFIRLARRRQTKPPPNGMAAFRDGGTRDAPNRR